MAYPAVFSAGQRRRKASAVATAATTFEDGGVPVEERISLKEHGEVKEVRNEKDVGPAEEYDRRVEEGLLKNDEHQRGE